MIRRLIFVFAIASIAVPAQASERTRLQGKFTQGGLVTGSTVPGSKLTLDGAAVMVAADGTLAFGFGRDAPVTAVLRITYPDGKTETRTLQVTAQKYRIQRINRVPPKYVTPPPEVMARITRERAAVKAARDTRLPVPQFKAGFRWPATGRVSGVFGSQRFFNGEPRAPHSGVDVAVGTGTPVRAPAPGTVTLASHLYFAGKTVIMDHGLGVSTTYIHLNEILVKPGDTVRIGQIFAKSGKTGRTTGPHLHWSMNWFQVRLDPKLMAPPMPKTVPKNMPKKMPKPSN